MSRNRKTAILLGLCTVLAACNDASTREITGPEPTTRPSDPALTTGASATLLVRQVNVGDFRHMADGEKLST